MRRKTEDRQKRYSGFTLVELLIVIVLLGFLSILGFSVFQGSQKRARDMRRKGDLGQIAKALEMYANDYGYPAADAQGKIMGCTGTPATVCQWGAVWSRGSIYMQKLPKDPGKESYCYQQTGAKYLLYAILERTDDPDYDASLLTCGGSKIYTYVLLSANITPTPTP